MPIYEYQCESCKHTFEVQQKFSDPLVEACVKCGQHVRKLISTSGILFKGTGWYVTDYSNKLKDPNTSKPDDSGAKDGKASESKNGESNASDTKSEPSPTSSSPSSPASSSATPSPSSPESRNRPKIEAS